MFKRILIANRGEIACRINRTCQRLRIEAIGVHSEADRNALHVQEIGQSLELGAAVATESYINIARVVAAAKRCGADAVHPGYGFLAENAAFARALAAEGITFIGPDAATLEAFGDKAEAKRLAAKAGLPIVAGSDGPLADIAAIEQVVAGMDLPVLLKAVAGGGGKGMRVVHDRAILRREAEAAMREAKSSFGDGRLIVEQYIAAARHVEVQILGDGRGHVVHLLDRECTLQRRHQKVIEEAPVLSLDAGLRQSLLDYAVRLGQSVNYRGLGTVEFIVSGNSAWFLEVNPRIQVEHPVTEAITGLDLVELQLRAVAGEGIALTQDDVRANGVAIEARLYAEDPARNFMPSAGRIEAIGFPPGLRVDTGIAPGMAVTPFYDPMIAKLIAHAPDRAAALAQLCGALDATRFIGPDNNLRFLARLLREPDVASNTLDTGFIDRNMERLAAAESASAQDAAIAAALWLKARRQSGGASPWQGWNNLGGWRLGDGQRQLPEADSLVLTCGDQRFGIRFGRLNGAGHLTLGVNGETFAIGLSDLGNGEVLASANDLTLRLAAECGPAKVGLNFGGRMICFDAASALGMAAARTSASDGTVRAPMMGKIILVDAVIGQEVKTGERLAALESMKMELAVNAPCNGRVAAVECRADNTVERDQILFRIEPL